MQKSNLDILIEHLQNEYDYLKSSMDQCSSEWDFEGAKAFRGPVIHTRRKLNVLKSLKNPNFKKTNTLKRQIEQIEKSLSKPYLFFENVDEQIKNELEKNFKKITTDRITGLKIKLKEIEKIKPLQSIDEDKILSLIEGLEENRIKRLELEIKKEKINLEISVSNNNLELKLKPINDKRVEYFLVSQTKSILGRLGFNLKTYVKVIEDFKNVDKIKILEELAIIYFEVFEIFGIKEIVIKSE